MFTFYVLEGLIIVFGLPRPVGGRWVSRWEFVDRGSRFTLVGTVILKSKPRVILGKDLGPSTL